MKATSYIIIWLTLFLLVIVAMLLGLILLLISEFYSSPIIHHHHRRHEATTPTTADATTTTGNNPITHSPSPENQESGEGIRRDELNNQKGCSCNSVDGFSLVYISNPIYGGGNGTPFETPESSPSRLETEESSGGDEGEEVSATVVVVVAPPLTPVKKLPEESCAVGLKDVRWSDMNSNNGVSSSCSSTPCTSPSL